MAMNKFAALQEWERKGYTGNSFANKPSQEVLDLIGQASGLFGKNIELPGLDPEKTYVFFDLETTGGNPADIAKEDYGSTLTPYSFSAIKYKGGRVIDAVSQLIYPNESITDEDTALTGMTNERLLHAPKWDAQMAQQIHDFIGDSVLAGYNIHQFDIPVLSGALKRFNPDLPELKPDSSRILDVYQLLRKKDYSAIRSSLPNLKLESVGNFLQQVAGFRSGDPGNSRSHEAFADTMTTMAALQAAQYEDLRRSQGSGDNKFGHLLSSGGTSVEDIVGANRWAQLWTSNNQLNRNAAWKPLVRPKQSPVVVPRPPLRPPKNELVPTEYFSSSDEMFTALKEGLGQDFTVTRTDKTWALVSGYDNFGNIIQEPVNLDHYTTYGVKDMRMVPEEHETHKDATIRLFQRIKAEGTAILDLQKFEDDELPRPRALEHSNYYPPLLSDDEGREIRAGGAISPGNRARMMEERLLPESLRVSQDADEEFASSINQRRPYAFADHRRLASGRYIPDFRVLEGKVPGFYADDNHLLHMRKGGGYGNRMAMTDDPTRTFFVKGPLTDGEGKLQNVIVDIIGGLPGGMAEIYASESFADAHELTRVVTQRSTVNPRDIRNLQLNQDDEFQEGRSPVVAKLGDREITADLKNTDRARILRNLVNLPFNPSGATSAAQYKPEAWVQLTGEERRILERGRQSADDPEYFAAVESANQTLLPFGMKFGGGEERTKPDQFMEREFDQKVNNRARPVVETIFETSTDKMSGTKGQGDNMAKFTLAVRKKIFSDEEMHLWTGSSEGFKDLSRAFVPTLAATKGGRDVLARFDIQPTGRVQESTGIPEYDQSSPRGLRNEAELVKYLLTDEGEQELRGLNIIREKAITREHNIRVNSTTANKMNAGRFGGWRAIQDGDNWYATNPAAPIFTARVSGITLNSVIPVGNDKNVNLPRYQIEAALSGRNDGALNALLVQQERATQPYLSTLRAAYNTAPEKYPYLDVSGDRGVKDRIESRARIFYEDDHGFALGPRDAVPGEYLLASMDEEFLEEHEDEDGSIRQTSNTHQDMMLTHGGKQYRIPSVNALRKMSDLNLTGEEQVKAVNAVLRLFESQGSDDAWEKAHAEFERTISDYISTPTFRRNIVGREVSKSKTVMPIGAPELERNTFLSPNNPKHRQHIKELGYSLRHMGDNALMIDINSGPEQQNLDFDGDAPASVKIGDDKMLLERSPFANAQSISELDVHGTPRTADRQQQILRDSILGSGFSSDEAEEMLRTMSEAEIDLHLSEKAQWGFGGRLDGAKINFSSPSKNEMGDPSIVGKIRDADEDMKLHSGNQMDWLRKLNRPGSRLQGTQSSYEMRMNIRQIANNSQKGIVYNHIQDMLAVAQGVSASNPGLGMSPDEIRGAWNALSMYSQQALDKSSALGTEVARQYFGMLKNDANPFTRDGNNATRQMDVALRSLIGMAQHGTNVSDLLPLFRPIGGEFHNPQALQEFTRSGLTWDNRDPNLLYSLKKHMYGPTVAQQVHGYRNSTQFVQQRAAGVMNALRIIEDPERLANYRDDQGQPLTQEKAMLPILDMLQDPNVVDAVTHMRATRVTGRRILSEPEFESGVNAGAATETYRNVFGPVRDTLADMLTAYVPDVVQQGTPQSIGEYVLRQVSEGNLVAPAQMESLGAQVTQGLGLEPTSPGVNVQPASLTQSVMRATDPSWVSGQQPDPNFNSLDDMEPLDFNAGAVRPTSMPQFMPSSKAASNPASAPGGIGPDPVPTDVRQQVENARRDRANRPGSFASGKTVIWPTDEVGNRFVSGIQTAAAVNTRMTTSDPERGQMSLDDLEKAVRENTGTLEQNIKAAQDLSKTMKESSKHFTPYERLGEPTKNALERTPEAGRLYRDASARLESHRQRADTLLENLERERFIRATGGGGSGGGTGIGGSGSGFPEEPKPQREIFDAMGGIMGLGYISWGLMGFNRINQFAFQPIQEHVKAYTADQTAKYGMQVAMYGATPNEDKPQTWARRQEFIQSYAQVRAGEQYFGLSKTVGNYINENFSIDQQATLLTHADTARAVIGVGADIGLAVTVGKMMGADDFIQKWGGKFTKGVAGGIIGRGIGGLLGRIGLGSLLGGGGAAAAGGGVMATVGAAALPVTLAATAAYAGFSMWKSHTDGITAAEEARQARANFASGRATGFTNDMDSADRLVRMLGADMGGEMQGIRELLSFTTRHAGFQLGQIKTFDDPRMNMIENLHSYANNYPSGLQDMWSDMVFAANLNRTPINSAAGWKAAQLVGMQAVTPIQTERQMTVSQELPMLFRGFSGNQNTVMADLLAYMTLGRTEDYLYPDGTIVPRDVPGRPMNHVQSAARFLYPGSNFELSLGLTAGIDPKLLTDEASRLSNGLVNIDPNDIKPVIDMATGKSIFSDRRRALDNAAFRADTAHMTAGWGFQRRDMDISWKYQQMGFDLQGRQMDLRYNQAMAGYDRSIANTNASYRQQQEMRVLQGAQMMMGFRHQEESMAAGFHIADTQMGWQFEDMSFGRNVAALQYEWSQEDFGRNIRLATGREKRELIRKREREQIMFGMQEGQRDKEEGRLDQRKQWQEEEHERTKRQYEERKAMQISIFELQGRHMDEDYQRQISNIEAVRKEMQDSHALDMEAFNNQKAQAHEMKQLAEDRFKEEKEHGIKMQLIQAARLKTAQDEEDLLSKIALLLDTLKTEVYPDLIEMANELAWAKNAADAAGSDPPNPPNPPANTGGSVDGNSTPPRGTIGAGTDGQRGTTFWVHNDGPVPYYTDNLGNRYSIFDLSADELANAKPPPFQRNGVSKNNASNAVGISDSVDSQALGMQYSVALQLRAILEEMDRNLLPSIIAKYNDADGIPSINKTATKLVPEWFIQWHRQADALTKLR